MPTTDPDKIYVKKFKINDLLNDLYSELTKNKPENPVEYAFKYFEAKMPPKPKTDLNVISFDIESNGSRKPSVAGGSSAGASGAADPAAGEKLFAKLFNARNLLGDKTNQMEDGQPADVSSGRLSSPGNADDQSRSNMMGMKPFFELNLLNQIQRKLVEKSKELTDEEILEREKIQFFGKEGDSSEEDLNENKQKIVTYKSQLKNRDLNDRHKQELRDLILQEQSKALERNQQEAFVRRENKKAKESRIRGLEMEEEQEDELSREFLIPNKINRMSEVNIERAKAKKVPSRDLSAQNLSIYHRQPHLSSRTSSMAPGVQYIICSQCNRIQNQVPSPMTHTPEPLLEVQPKDEVRIDTKGLNAASLTERIDQDAKNTIPPAQDQDKGTADLRQSIFDILTNKSKRDSKNDTFDDDNIESASQVSGPRPIAPFEASTNRSASDKPGDKHYDGDIMSWVLNNQKLGNQVVPEVPFLGLESSIKKDSIRPSETATTAAATTNVQSPPSSVRKSSSRAGSKVSSRIETASNASKSSRRETSSKPSESNNDPKWKMKDSSSDLSTLVNKDTTGKKK